MQFNSHFNPGASSSQVKYFDQDLPTLMYGAGDSSTPLEETVDVVENLVLLFIKNVMDRVKKSSDRRGTIHLDDVLHSLRDDGKKYMRARELLAIDKEIRKVKNADKDVGERVAKDEQPAPVTLTEAPVVIAPKPLPVPPPLPPGAKRKRGRPRKYPRADGTW